MARRGNLLLVLRTILQEIATPACGLVRNDTVVGTHVRRFQQLDKLQFTLPLHLTYQLNIFLTAPFSSATIQLTVKLIIK